MTAREHVSDQAVQAVAAATAALVSPHDVIGTVAQLLQSAAGSVGSTAAGLILRRLGQDQLQLLAATSHRAEELEAYQAQHEEGPCFDAVETGVPVRANGRLELAARWPVAAPAFERAGYTAVQAFPLHWHEHVIGALNLFWTDQVTPVDRSFGEIFANLATLIVIHSDPVTAGQVLNRTRSALDERTVIERAKGVLAHEKSLSMDAAYGSLLEQAARDRQQVTTTAAAIVDQAQARPTGHRLT